MLECDLLQECKEVILQRMRNTLQKNVNLYMAASTYHVISKEVENCMFRKNQIFNTPLSKPWKTSNT